MTEYQYLGDFSAVDPVFSRRMTCYDCKVCWDGCWDNFQCPKCGEGELPDSNLTKEYPLFRRGTIQGEIVKERGIIMKETPLLFKPEMVRATLREIDPKEQTRRLIKRLLKFGKITEFGISDTPGYDWHFRDEEMRWHDISHARLMEYCPCGQPGDHLYAKESWRTETNTCDPIEPSEMSHDEKIIYEADGNWSSNRTVGRYRHARFMPRWVSRILLEITDIRVERLQDITEEGAIAEGVQRTPDNFAYHINDERFRRTRAVECYADYWDHINGVGSWDANPWVWVISFRKLDHESHNQ